LSYNATAAAVYSEPTLRLSIPVDSQATNAALQNLLQQPRPTPACPGGILGVDRRELPAASFKVFGRNEFEVGIRVSA
jgi:hypothetical protein